MQYERPAIVSNEVAQASGMDRAGMGDGRRRKVGSRTTLLAGQTGGRIRERLKQIVMLLLRQALAPLSAHLPRTAWSLDSGRLPPAAQALDAWRRTGHRRRRLLLAGVVVVGLATAPAEVGAQGSVEMDRAALVALYDATDGPNWLNTTNWLTDTPLGEWHGVVTDEGGRVTALILQRNQLSGTIPSQLENLTSLETLVLQHNQLSGTIPSQLENLTSLETLVLQHNQLSGTIPSQLENLTSLEVLALNDNQLSGTIPSQLGNLTSDLYFLGLANNQLSGTIPSQLGNLTGLRTLVLWNNQLTGTIPAELGDLTSLEFLALNENQLTGQVPAALGSLTSLEFLALNENQLTGQVPAALGNLTSLETLAIDTTTGLCLAPDFDLSSLFATLSGLSVCPPLPKEPAAVQSAVDAAIAAATNDEGLRTGGASVTVPLDALFTFPSSAASGVTFMGTTFSVLSTAPGVVSVSTSMTDAGPVVELTPGGDAGTATVTVDARPEGQPDTPPLASVMFEMEVTRSTSMDATLSGLVLSDGTGEVALTPAFDPATESYTAMVANSVTSVTATPTVTEPAATVTVNGAAVASGSPSEAIELEVGEVGENVITVVVTAEDGATTSTYTVEVTRSTSMDATLSGLVLSDGTGEVALTPAFDPATESYTAMVANSVTSVTATPTVTEPAATVTVNGAAVASGSPSEAIELEVGENVITVVVTAEDGATTSTYTVEVTRSTSMDATLSGLVLSDGTGEVALTPAFDPATESYTAMVANSVTSVTATPTVTEPAATVTVNGAAVASGSPSEAIELEVGESVITVVVTAEDGATTSTYTVEVTRSTAVPALPFGGALLLGILLACLGGRRLLQQRRCCQG